MCFFFVLPSLVMVLFFLLRYCHENPRKNSKNEVAIVDLYCIRRSRLHSFSYSPVRPWESSSNNNLRSRTTMSRAQIFHRIRAHDFGVHHIFMHIILHTLRRWGEMEDLLNILYSGRSFRSGHSSDRFGMTVAHCELDHSLTMLGETTRMFSTSRMCSIASSIRFRT